MSENAPDERPFVHAFARGGLFIMYDVNRNAVLRLSRDQYQLVQAVLGGSADMRASRGPVSRIAGVSEAAWPTLSKWYHALSEAGYFSATRPARVRHPATGLAKELTDTKINSLCLQATTECNLRCRYCVYSGRYHTRSHGPGMMSAQVARRAIDFLLRHSSGSDGVYLSYYGGEPLLNLDMLRDSTGYFSRTFDGRKRGLRLVTNGTLLNQPGTIDFLISNSFDLQVSLDGPCDVHDRNRVTPSGRGSFDSVIRSVRFLAKRHPRFFKEHVSFHAVMDPQVDPCGAIRFFDSCEGLRKAAAITMMPVEQSERRDEADFQPSAEYVRKLNHERFKYLLYRTGRLRRREISEVTAASEGARMARIRKTLAQESVQVPEVFHPSGPCVPGLKRTFVDIHGNLRPCEKVSEKSDATIIGHIDRGYDVERIRKILTVATLTKRECLACWAWRFCIGCIKLAVQAGRTPRANRLAECESIRWSAERLLGDHLLLTENGFEIA